MTLQERAKAVLELRKAASPAPWFTKHDGNSNYRAEITALTVRGLSKAVARCPVHPRATAEANAAFIAASHESADVIEALLALVAELERDVGDARYERVCAGHEADHWRLRAQYFESEFTARLSEAIKDVVLERPAVYLMPAESTIRESALTRLVEIGQEMEATSDKGEVK